MQTVDLSTYEGWMAAARALLAGKPDWTALRDEGGFVVQFNGEVFLAAERDKEHQYSEDDLFDPDPAFWDEGAGAWYGVNVNRCRALIEKPQIVELPHA